MFFRKKSKQEKRSTLIIEEMVTDNNGIPILNFGDDAAAFKEAQAQHSQNRKRSTKKPGSTYSKHFED